MPDHIMLRWMLLFTSDTGRTETSWPVTDLRGQKPLGPRSRLASRTHPATKQRLGIPNSRTYKIPEAGFIYME